MFIDLVAMVLIGLAIFKGVRKGLIVALFSFLAFFVGLAAALKLSAVAAAYISESANVTQRWLPVLAFLLVFVIVVFLIRIGAKMVEGVVRLAMLGWLNRMGGIFFYLLIYFFIFSIIVFYAVQLKLFKPAMTDASITFPYIQALAPKFMNAAGAVFPFLKDVFSNLLHFFQNVSNKHQQGTIVYAIVKEHLG
jgi:membrane protein required for colicin V production